MGKQLVITEKPSVARDIARAIKVGKKGDHFEDDRYVITSAVGHLLELAEPEPPASGDGRRRPGKWTLGALPALPERFDLRPIGKTEKQLRQIQGLLKRADVDGLINACDAGREGELIFHNIVRHAGSGLPVRRLWLQSMTPKAIRDGFGRLREGKEMVPLREAAVGRSEADWLIGINSTRAMTALNSPEGSFNLTTVGRVQTPTLAMLVAREREIRAFTPRTYWEVTAQFAAAAGNYEGKWVHPAGHKPAEKGDRNTWIFDGGKAAEIVARCQGRDGTVSETKRPTRSAPPQLFDLTSLQRDANRRFGFSARSTLAIAQALYESQAITYPRTDSRRLPEDYPATAEETLRKLAEAGAPADLRAHAAAALEQGLVRKAGKRVFDNSKVSDHFAIIPTGEPVKSAKEQDRKLYGLVATHFVATFFPAAQLEITERRTVVEGETFLSRGRVVVDPGWMAVTGRADADADGKDGGKAEAKGKGKDKGGDADRELTAVREGETVRADPVGQAQAETRPPRRHNEATLLAAMESAGKMVDDEEMRESLKERGLGTPATRAAIIEGLIRERYVTRDRQELIPGEKAFSLLRLLDALKIDALTKPELTGEWEAKLKRVEGATYRFDEFMGGIRKMTEEIVDAAKRYDAGDGKDEATEPTGVSCPACGEGGMLSGIQRYRCDRCGHAIRKVWCERPLSVEELSRLVADGRVGPFDDFVSRRGTKFTAALVLGEKKIPEYEMEKRDEPATPADLEDSPRLGACPKCGEGQVADTPRGYVCERGAGDPPQCDFRIGRRILQREISAEEMAAMLKDGKTEVLSGFVSRRTGRPFAARLRLEQNDEGEYRPGFEFDNTRSPGGGARKPGGAAAPRPKPERPADLDGSDRLGECPQCKEGQVADTSAGYLCDRVPECDFRLDREILQRAMSAGEVRELLEKGKTALLEGFVSRRTGRAFSAHLTLEEKHGRIRHGYEFDQSRPRRGR